MNGCFLRTESLPGLRSTDPVPARLAAGRIVGRRPRGERLGGIARHTRDPNPAPPRFSPGASSQPQNVFPRFLLCLRYSTYTSGNSSCNCFFLPFFPSAQIQLFPLPFQESFSYSAPETFLAYCSEKKIIANSCFL